MLGFLLCASPALALCNGVGGSLPTLQPAVPVLSASYDPARPTVTVVTTTVTVNAAVGMSPPCTLSIILLPTFSSGLAKGSDSLPYSVGGELGAAVTPSPFGGIQMPMTNGSTQTFTASMIIPNRQNVPQAHYAEDRNLMIYTSSGQYLTQTTFSFVATVLASCMLPSPSVGTLNFSQGIVNGRVTQGYKLSALIQGASCSGPARLVLRGTPMQTEATVPAGFDNKIYYQATAKLGAVTTILNVDSTGEALATLPATSGTVSIDVALVDKGKMQAAGTYSSVLSVVLEPSN